MLNAVKASGNATKSAQTVVYKLRDKSGAMIEAWKEAFSKHKEGVEISTGDIFQGAPYADAIVSPANSFGFMDGGIDMVYSWHFGRQMMDRLQDEIRAQKDGELLVGDALIIPCYEDEQSESAAKVDSKNSSCNDGKLIKYLISAPTMRTPQNVADTVNAYLAFRAVILAVKRHNADSSKEPIHSVLCPGLGTAVGRMPYAVAAKQMLLAYETFQLGMHSYRLNPKKLYTVGLEELDLKKVVKDGSDEHA